MKYLKKIKTEAAKRNITIKQLADSINITTSVFIKAVKNGTLSIEQLNKICKILDMEVSEIFRTENHVTLGRNKKHQFLNNKLFC